MDYPVNNSYMLRDITKEIYDKLEAEGKVTYISVDKSEKINYNILRRMIKAKREHIKNQVLSRKKSLEILFNA